MATSMRARWCIAVLLVPLGGAFAATPTAGATPLNQAEVTCSLQRALPITIGDLVRLDSIEVLETADRADRELHRSRNGALGVWRNPDELGRVRVRMLRASFESRVHIDGVAVVEDNGEITVSANRGVVLIDVTGTGTMAHEPRLTDILDNIKSGLPDECLEDDEAEVAATIALIFALLFLAGGPAAVRVVGARRQLFDPPTLSSDELAAFGVHSASYKDGRESVTARRTASSLRCGAWWIAICIWAAAGFEVRSGRSENALLLAAPFAIFVVVAGHLLSRRHLPSGLHPHRRASWLRLGRFRALSWLLVLIAAWLLWVALNAAITAGHRSVQNDVEVVLATLEDGGLTTETRIAINSITPFVALPYVAASIIVLWAARRMALIDVEKLLRRDRRAPVLLLRSFSDDDLRLRASASARHGAVGRLGLRPFERFEELLAWVLSSYGPLVAVQDPTRSRRHLGAARETIDGSDWLTAVQMRVQHAALIVVVVGEPSASDGLAAELELLKEADVLHKVIFVLPPVDTSTLIRRWWDAAHIVDACPILPTDGFPALATIQAGITHFTAADNPVSDVGYETAIDIECARRGMRDPATS